MTREKLMNVERFQRRLAESEFDAVVAVSQPNVFYTSGAVISTQTVIPDRLALTVLPKEGEEAILVCAIEEGLVRRESWIEDVRCYREFVLSPISLLVNVLKEKGLDGGRVGIEKRYLSAAYYEELVELLPQTRFEACDDLFEGVRGIKTEREVEKFREAALATERAIVEAFHEARVGQTEKELLDCILDKVIALGANDISLAVLAAGDQSAHAHPKARARELQPGDLIRADIGGMFSGYGSDVARMAIVGGATEAQRDMYSKHRAIQRGAVELMRPGVRACDIFEYCVRSYAKLGIEYPWPHVGHGFGLSGHEVPMLQPHNTQELRPNMLICAEPTYLDKHMGGYQVKDLVLIKGDGAEILTSYSDTKELQVIQ